MSRPSNPLCWDQNAKACCILSILTSR
jgi:hypothetical protein